MPTIQVLIATVDRKGVSLPTKMNISSDAIICDQCGITKNEEFIFNENKIKLCCFNERGVGKNRNRALELASADISLIADDDMTYADGYSELVKKEFAAHPKADVILFNVVRANGLPYKVRKPFRVRYHNFMRFGAVRIAFRTQSVKECGIIFSEIFGGGTRYSHGEDSLFLKDCLDNGLRLVAVPTVIAHLNNERNSTWFSGFDSRYFSDQGALYAAISRKFCLPLCFQDAYRHRKKYAIHGSFIKNYKEMRSGAKNFLLTVKTQNKT